MIFRKLFGTSAVRWGLLFAGMSLLLSVSGFRAQDADPGWPRDIQIPQGTITIYQPQAESPAGPLPDSPLSELLQRLERLQPQIKETAPQLAGAIDSLSHSASPQPGH